MKIVKNIYPLIKIKLLSDIDFYNKHIKIINLNGYVQFCRFGKNKMKKSVLISYLPIIVSKKSDANSGHLLNTFYIKILDLNQLILQFFTHILLIIQIIIAYKKFLSPCFQLLLTNSLTNFCNKNKTGGFSKWLLQTNNYFNSKH